MPTTKTSPKPRARRLGPRGGTTTSTESGLVRKTLWIHDDEAEALRAAAYEQRRSESEIMRQALRMLLKIED